MYYCNYISVTLSKAEKLVEKFKSVPADLTWAELTTILGILGFKEISSGKTSGSRCKFMNKNKVILIFHKPHPGNIVKKYVIEQTLENLMEKGIIS